MEISAANELRKKSKTGVLNLHKLVPTVLTPEVTICHSIVFSLNNNMSKAEKNGYFAVVSLRKYGDAS